MPRRTTDSDEDSVTVAASAGVAGDCNGGSRTTEAARTALFVDAVDAVNVDGDDVDVDVDDDRDDDGDEDGDDDGDDAVLSGCHDGSCQYCAHSFCSWRLAVVTGSATTAGPASSSLESVKFIGNSFHSACTGSPRSLYHSDCAAMSGTPPAAASAAAAVGVEVVAMVRFCACGAADRAAVLPLLLFAVQNCGAAGWKNMLHSGAAAAAVAVAVVVASASAASMAVAASVPISRLNGVVKSTCASSWKNMPHCGTACFGGAIAAVVDMDAVAVAVAAVSTTEVRLSKSSVGVCVANRCTDRAPEVAGPLRIGVHDNGVNGDVLAVMVAAMVASPRWAAAVLLLFKIGVHDCTRLAVGVAPPHGGSSTGRAALKAVRAVVDAAEKDIL